MSATGLGIVAGSGPLPVRLAAHAAGAGRQVTIIALKGWADPQLLASYGGAECSMGEIGKAIDTLRAAKAADVVFAGVVRKPDFKTLRFDLRGAALTPRLVAAAGKGDDALLRVVLGAFEDAGFRVVGADDVLADLLAREGAMGMHAPNEADWTDIRRAAAAARRIGAADIAQGAVARGGEVIATEQEAGTDAMLRALPRTDKPGGVLVKLPKPQQERRIDLPTIGLDTVRNAHAAGLRGVAVEAGGALVMNREEMIAEADRLGLFVLGLAPGEVA